MALHVKIISQHANSIQEQLNLVLILQMENATSIIQSTCITILNVSTDCAKITGVSLTYEICQSYNLGCSVNRAKTACVQKAAQCSGYSTAMTGCYQAGEGLCIASTSNDSACVPASSSSTCETVFLGTGNYTHDNCSAIKAGCTVNGSTGCMARTCANATGFTFNHDNCYSWLKTCTVNQTNNGCTIMTAKCSDQSSTQCLNAIEGVCLSVQFYLYQKRM
ncbi:unnamed protein product (macronuclear) [Paramecium tetraurelia]|uniref:Uncharacterized protein n=1 Tax=Paramecium tetraurelia TaxID=5888 RepID=A0CHJ2_PARTE|nr:uncharacterized protein GSPATT00038361001 [Paramecium tetraurelia]CAK70259.1 unnamed protein product [Paramecium tetraurelia]|eukprot:XP_001437656.1 hypothetical protein (macronuclear) [Paramecium tetraurelia strain d4-2]